MPRCDLATGASRIRHALKELETAWNQASSEWKDAVSRRFNEQHMQPIIAPVKLALDAINRMSLLLDEVERDCES